MLLALAILGSALAPLAAQTLPSILSQMDASSASFQSLTARIRLVKHTEIVKDETVDEGTIWVKRVKPRVSRFLIEFTVPDRYYVSMTERKAEIYRPKIAQVEEYDVAKYRDLAEQVWPFGASGKDLAARYHVTLKGAETIAGNPAMKLELIPKSPKLLQHLPRVEMWISTTHWQPIQQKFYDVTPGDFRLSTYTDVKLNVSIPDSKLRLPLAPGTKRIQPQK